MSNFLKKASVRRLLSNLKTVVQVTLLATVMSVPIFYILLRRIFAGPEVAFFTAVNIAIMMVFFSRMKKYIAKYGAGAVQKARILLFSYTALQSVLSIITLRLFEIWFMVYAEFVILAFLWRWLGKILAVPREVAATSEAHNANNQSVA